MKTEATKLTAQNLILTVLKEGYFRRAKQEKIGTTKQLTEEMDLLEIAIQELTQQIKDVQKN
jgi:hypothetical protein